MRRGFVSFIESALAGADWQLEQGGDGNWLVATPPDSDLPPQGWKLHVSASVATAERVIERVVPVLAARRTGFKVAASERHLAELNDGQGGISQIGKFMTIYPRDDREAVALADEIDRLTTGLAGPVVPSDRPLRRASAVSYRFGGFDGRSMQLPYGEIVPAITDSDGRLVPDRRDVAYRALDWIVDPFEAAGVAQDLPEPEVLIDGRLLLASLLHASPRGTVHLALDLDNDRRCVVKRASAGEGVSLDGTDARDRLRHEYAVLRALAPHPAFPQPYELLEHEGDVLLVMEDVDGRTLAAEVADGRALGRLPSSATVCGWGAQLARALAVVHESGLVFRDVKPTNVIVTPTGALRIIDLELAHDPASGDPVGLGTRGYMSPHHRNGAAATVADDIYGLGATLYFAATGAEPAQTPHADPLSDRPPRLVNPHISEELAVILEGCLGGPGAGFETMHELEAALVRAAPAKRRTPVADASPTARANFHDQAQRLGATLVARAQRAPGSIGKTWHSDHFTAMGTTSLDINAGTAGIVLVLSELVLDGGGDAMRQTLSEAVDWLRVAQPPPGPGVAGLYVGASGIAIAILRAGQALEDGELIALAERRMSAVVELPFGSPDIFNGTAGRLRAHLLMWDQTAAEDQLDAAIAAGEHLLSTAEWLDDGEVQWTIPDGYSEMSGTAMLGYAHGCAGIADVLLDLFSVTGDARAADATVAVASRLRRLAQPSLDDGSGVEWPRVEGSRAMGPMWCHGSAGIGRFFLNAGRLGLVPDGEEIAIRAARTVALGGRALGPVQCHGLAGGIELLLDVHQQLGGQTYHRQALSLAELLQGFRVERDGHLLWVSDRAEVIAPDYLVGYSGVAVCLSRLAQADTRPHQLTRAGFRWTAA